ncbi:MAG TPA: hypothetical protein PKC72_05160 [Chitinophagaceae bacterium]|nr:hypothetical protein [Chitinophagaceae bacterium]
MRKKVIFTLLLILSFSNYLIAQDKGNNSNRLKVFIDCSNTYCDFTFIRTEINIVDFLLDNQAADLHILITDQSTGGGGRQYQMIFFGQNKFKSQSDTLRFSTDPNATDFERRDLLVKYLKIGLVPYIAKTSSVSGLDINMKQDDNLKKESTSPTKDPWNYWVFRTGVNGYLDADANYNSSNISGSFSAKRITDQIKIGLELDGGKNRSAYKLDDGNGNIENIIIKNNSYNIQQYLVKSLGEHWSTGYQVELSRSTFSNNKSRFQFLTGIEYNIFSYKDVNTKRFTFSYLLDLRHNSYIDTTLFDKTKETLLGQGINSKLTFNQKWGTTSFGLQYHNYFRNWKLLNLEGYFEVDIRITGGLSFYVYTSAELARDQIYLPKGGATAQEILTRRRQLASGYRVYSNFGINYRFGSKLNNFVNPRFD